MIPSRFTPSGNVDTKKLAVWLQEPGLSTEDYANMPIPETMSALTLQADDEAIAGSIAPGLRKPSQFLHYRQVLTPEPQAGEVLVAVMAAGINYNNVWSSVYQPGSPFMYLRQYAALHRRNRRHLQPFMILGSDASGIVLRVGPDVENCKPGDAVCINTAVVDEHAPETHHDVELSTSVRAWGFETNYGAFAEMTLVRATQIMPKPTHLSWEEAASLPLVNGTVYRMLVSGNGAQLRAGENILIWGAAGGLGLIACQYAKLCGATPVAVVSRAERAEVLRRIGVEHVIDRHAQKIDLWKDNQPNERAMLKMRRNIRKSLEGNALDVVFEHPGMETFWASVALPGNGARIVTCGSTTGYQHQYDNRRLWMQVKSVIGCHGANYYEACKANMLVCKGRIQPVLTCTAPLAAGMGLIDRLHANEHTGKFGLLCLTPETGKGITAPERREEYGTDKFLAALGAENAASASVVDNATE
ncbi:crotonyl-CoA carboxylase/reductase [Salmonella enterica subsp. enterica serovar Infantis]|nr:crotonyl-CoA carboxylase/reductase [Salmonella enterica subsp. enterica serovar Javiana]EHC4525250.1 crotonyl-CoA carboxylase/reductase [Salmonella enterica subsp. enterica serovar Infantis]EHJ8320776.1 crotonyl-CoA carboxylase/reductase [Salmonella enterica subsp. enterica serovar Infantis]ELD4653737.1 crotonyl-CoA carboxylase/reductase [Salmonella enterica subsp. enterica serovar Javiana]